MCDCPPKARYRQHRRVRRRGWLCSAECTTELADFVERSSPATRPPRRGVPSSLPMLLKTVVQRLKSPNTYGKKVYIMSSLVSQDQSMIGGFLPIP